VLFLAVHLVNFIMHEAVKQEAISAFELVDLP
jgi:hypothetical protein